MKLEDIETVLNDERIKNSGFVLEGHTPTINMSVFSDETVWKMTEKGGWCFIPVSDGIYKCHFGYTEKASPFFAISHSKQCFKEMVDSGAVKLVGFVASQNLIARRFLEKIGCQSVSRKSGPYEYDRQKTDIEVYEWVL